MHSRNLQLHRRTLAFLLSVLATLLSPLGHQRAGAEPPPLLLGQSCALSGPAKNLGQELRAGLLAAFGLTNDQGGVKGRQIRLLSLDDGYEPDRAVRNTLRLITEDEVFLLIGEVGTPTSKAVIPIIEEYRVPFFAPFTGAEFLRRPFRAYIVNVRPSYHQEMEEIASYLVDSKKFTRIACFYQNDSYGYAGLEGIELALARRGLQLAASASYERNTLAVLGSLEEIHRAAPEAVVLVGAYPACAEFIKLSRAKFDRNPVFCSISFVGTESLRDELGRYGSGVIVSQVVPEPFDTSIPLLAEYHRAMKLYQHDAPLSFASLEGYISGKLFVAIASAVPGELSREAFLATMEQVEVFELGGLVLKYGPDDRQGLETIYLTTIYPEIKRVVLGEGE